MQRGADQSSNCADQREGGGDIERGENKERDRVYLLVIISAISVTVRNC